MRTLERNKKVLIKYANRDAEITDDYGMPISVYSEIKSARLSLIPLSNAVEATNYGVDLDKSFKVVLDETQCDWFKADTRIWINNEPDIGATNFDYTVSIAPLKSINGGTMVITKRTGA